MEEVDQIVLYTLRQVGCDFEDFSSLREFTTEAAMEGVVRCLNLITPSLELSPRIPPNMSGKYRLGTALATACVDLGYKGEIGYQTFLYSNETDMRKIFLFLFENLPKESEKSVDEPLNKTSVIMKEVSASLSSAMNSMWLPKYCRLDTSNKSKLMMKNPLFHTDAFSSVNILTPHNENSATTESYKKYCKNYMPALYKQVKVGPRLISSILEYNSLLYAKEKISERNKDDLSLNIIGAAKKQSKIREYINELLTQSLKHRKDIKFDTQQNTSQDVQNSRFTHSLELQFSSDKINNISLNIDTDQSFSEEKLKKRDEEIKELQEKVDSLTESVEILIGENKRIEVSTQNLLEYIKKEQSTIDEIKEVYRVKKCTFSLLPDADTNIKKLQNLIESSSQRLVSLANQWEQHRVPLIEEYRQLRELSSRRVNETQKKLEEIKTIREKIQNLGQEAKQKEEMHKHLLDAYEKLTKEVSRSTYTRRIMEIVGNIKKQKIEIDKVLLDTRNVQKEINSLSGKLERTFTVTDELIFRDAKKDEAVRKAYKYLASLHENCSQLVQIVEETGSIVREIRELEDKIDQENQKGIAANLERITSDYKQMQQENALLMNRLK